MSDPRPRRVKLRIVERRRRPPLVDLPEAEEEPPPLRQPTADRDPSLDTHALYDDDGKLA